MTMDIPNDVIIEIFSKLPAKFLLRFRWVSKYWFKVITDPNFVKMHLNNVHATNNPLVLICSPGGLREFGSVNFMDHDHDDVLHPLDIKLPVSFNSWRMFIWILDSCNGLLCIRLSEESREKIFIWNPCTKQYKTIWQDDHSDTSPNQGFVTSYGFGYDCSIDDYKVIRNVCSYNDGETLVGLYTLGTNSWKKLCNSRFFLDWHTSGLFVNGDLYWKAGLTKSGPFNIIVAFDVAKEEYRQIANPPCINHDESDCYMNLGKLKGCLCVLNITANKQSVEFWMMRHNVDDMKEEYSWDRLYTISVPPNRDFWHIKPVSFCKNGEIAMMMNMTVLILYSPKNNQIRFLHKGREISTVETYIESLVSIKGGTYMGQEP